MDCPPWMYSQPRGRNRNSGGNIKQFKEMYKLYMELNEEKAKQDKEKNVGKKVNRTFTVFEMFFLVSFFGPFATVFWFLALKSLMNALPLILK